MMPGKNNIVPDEALVLPVLTDALVVLALTGIDAIKSAGAVTGDQIRAIIEVATYGATAREIIEREVVIPSLADVSALRARLAAAVLASGGNKLAVDAKLIIDQMTDGLRKSEQNRFIADQAMAGYARAFLNASPELRETIGDMAHDSDQGYEVVQARDQVAAIVAFLKSIWPTDDPDNPLIKREVASNDA